MKPIYIVIVTFCVFANAEVKALTISQAQIAFADQLREGNYLYPVIESGTLEGQPALFDDPAVAFASNDGFWRALLKGAAVVAGGVAGAAVGTLVAPGAGTAAGGATGALAAATVVNEINRQGPGPGRKWLISDARLYDRVEVAGVGNILPDVVSTSLSHIESTVDLSSALSLAFIDSNIISVGVKDSSGLRIDTVDFAQAFILTSTVGSTTSNFFGSVVLNTIGFQDSVALTNTDFLDIDVGPLLTAPDGTEVFVRSTPIVGFSEVSEPPVLMLLGASLFILIGHRCRMSI